MDKLRIIGGQPLNGTIRISGAKNAALPLMTAALLTEESLRLTNFPRLADILTLAQLLEQLGLDIQITDEQTGPVATLTAKQITSVRAPYDLVRKMRASILVLGPLLARAGQAEVSLPGGCAIGARPVNFHVWGSKKWAPTSQLKMDTFMPKLPKG